jgi:hypothetical protein
VGAFVSDKLIIFTAHIDRSDMTSESTAVTVDWLAWLEATWSFGGAATIRRAAGGSSTRRDHVTCSLAHAASAATGRIVSRASARGLESIDGKHR